MQVSEITESQQLDTSSILTADLIEIFDEFEKAGFTIKIAGGAVRDLVQGKDPKDIDLATDATPEEMMQVLQQWHIIETGLEHGTITVNADRPYEITTLRKDVKSIGGRRAEVEWIKDFHQDSKRRDLTMNAMFMDLDGNIEDFHGGQGDIASGTARFVGVADERIQEDYLRILRYFRFQGRVATPKWDKETLQAIQRNVKGLGKISGERIREETQKIISGDHAPEILQKMKDTGVAEKIGLPTNRLKEFSKMWAQTRTPIYLLATLVDDDKQWGDLKNRWKFSNNVFKIVMFLVKNRDRKLNLHWMKTQVNFSKMNIAHELAILATMQGQKNLASAIKAYEKVNFPVTGWAIMSALDLQKGGAEVGKATAKLKQLWADSKFKLGANDLLSTLRSPQDDQHNQS